MPPDASSAQSVRADQVRKGDRLVFRGATFEIYSDPRPSILDGCVVLAYNGHVGTYRNSQIVKVFRA